MKESIPLRLFHDSRGYGSIVISSNMIRIAVLYVVNKEVIPMPSSDMKEFPLFLWIHPPSLRPSSCTCGMRLERICVSPSSVEWNCTLHWLDWMLLNSLPLLGFSTGLAFVRLFLMLGWPFFANPRLSFLSFLHG